jgi:hypothetical protein
MFERLEQSTDRCLAVHFSEKPTGQEYQQFVSAVEEQFEPGHEPNLVVDLTGVKGYGDFEAFRKDVKFGAGEYRHIHRAALVGDQKWIDWYMRILAPFTPAEEKHFAEGKVQDAVVWASA